MTVKELIKQLLDYNPNAQVYIGDNLYNEIELTYGSSDGVTKENCEDVGFHIKGNYSCETPVPDYHKIAMYDCHTCANYKTKCDPENDKFECKNPPFTSMYDNEKLPFPRVNEFEDGASYRH